MEEDIKILEKMCTENWCIGHSRVKQAIENLIARNKELEEENKTIDNAQKELKEELERQINAREISEKYIEDNFMTRTEVKESLNRLDEIVKRNYIKKSKVKDEISYLMQKYDLEEDYINYEDVIKILQELL